MCRPSRFAAVFCLLFLPSPLPAHLGEVHPAGKHDYFPDFSVSPLSDQIYFRNVLSVADARDLEEIPDGTGRFLAVRLANQVKLTAPDRINERLYVRSGEEADAFKTEGATSVAIHPEFATLGHPGYGKFYTVSIDRNPELEADFQSLNGASFSNYVISEWTNESPAAENFTGTSRDLMRFDEGSIFHNVNHLLFGPDGYLYIAVGEDTIGSQSSNLGSVYGKILRIDPLGTDSANGQYGIPVDNPFNGIANAAPEVFAYGLRNPWRMAFDRVTHDLFVVDVGLDSIEEASLVQSGQNYGWPTKEGSMIAAKEAYPDEPDPETGLTVGQQNGFVEPLFQLDHSDTASIIGGVVYRGERFPELQGKFIFGSWNTNQLYVGDPTTGDTQILVDGTRLREFMEGQDLISINEDLDGEIYLSGGPKIVSLFALPDFDRNDIYDAPDVDQICAAFGSQSSKFDLDGDLRVDQDDIQVFLDFAHRLPGDLDLNGSVEFADFLALAHHFGSELATWSEGNLDCVGGVEFSDFLTFVDNFGKSADPGIVAAPEPSSGLLLLISIAFLHHGRRSRNIAR